MSMPFAGWQANTTSSLSISTPTGWIPPRARFFRHRWRVEHHVVAIKRKFGTPVIATSDPDDLTAQDNVRASIGRDFISVVAAPDQIGNYLDQLFGPEGEATTPENTSEPFVVDEEVEAKVDPEPVEASVLVDDESPQGSDPFEDLLSEELDGKFGIIEEAESAIADDAALPAGGQENAETDDDVLLADEGGGDAHSALTISPVSFDDADWQEFPTESQVEGNGLAPETSSAEDQNDLIEPGELDDPATDQGSDI